MRYYLEYRNFIMFSSANGEQCQLMMEDYTIEIGESIVPVSQTDTTSGGIVT